MKGLTMPPMPRFSGHSNRAEKKKNITDRLKAFFDMFFGVS